MNVETGGAHEAVPHPPVSPLVGDWFFKGAATKINKKESYEAIN